MLKKIAWLILVLSIAHGAVAQTKVNPADSTQLYQDIARYAQRNKLTQFLYRLLFKPITNSKPVSTSAINTQIRKPYRPFEGKIIRNIIIQTLDPFEQSLNDTARKANSFLAKQGNHIHIKTKQLAIKNLLLIKTNQVFDSLLVKESERLIRSKSFIRDVIFIIVPIADSVDIYIRALDTWSIIPRFSGAATQFNLSLLDKNFLGLGHEFKNNYTRQINRADYDFDASYFVPNIRNTFISTTLNYGADEFGNFRKSIALDRPFYSPYTKWASGISYAQQYNKNTIDPSDTLDLVNQYKFNIQDYWAGYAKQVFKGNSEASRTTNFIAALRYYQINYLSMPSLAIDSANNFRNEQFYLSSFSLSTRRYLQAKYIFNYGITEDIPIGKVYAITLGYQIRDNISRTYFGNRLSFGAYYSWGYLSCNLEYGTFLKKSKAEQGMLSASVVYFTNLVAFGKWRFRQFVKPQLTLGLNRLDNEQLSLNDGVGLVGFNSPSLIGINRYALTFQTQCYAPWNIIGFRFGPYLVYSCGALSNKVNELIKSKVYNHIGLGLLIRNENLIFNTFQVSLSFYPIIPAVGNQVIKLNSLRSNDFTFKNFETGKPSALSYQ